VITNAAMTPDPRLVAPAGAAHDRIYRDLRTRILHGEIAPATPMTLRGIAAEFGVSMTPAREAVRRLAAEGALTLSASGRIATPRLRDDRIEELASLRALLEPDLASRALPRVHLALLDRLAAIDGRAARAMMRQDVAGYVRANLDFHRTLYLRAQAPAVLAMTETVWLQLGPTMRALHDRRGRSEPPPTHRPILAALRSADDAALRLAVRADVVQGLRMLRD